MSKKIEPEFWSSHNEQQISDLLTGRRIVAADLNADTLTLDNGTVLQLIPNEGCACANGNYTIEALNTCDNVITKAEIVEDENEWGDYGDVHLFVYAEGLVTPLEIVRAEGVDNGYYGTGFHIRVKALEGDQS